MADADDVRRLALGLPHVEEIDSDGFDFRVGGKGFVWSYPERTPGKPRVIRTDIAVLYVGDEAEKQALLLGEPRLFFTAPGYDGWPLVMLRLAEVDTGRLAELVTDAWRMRAPEALAADLDPGPHRLPAGSGRDHDHGSFAADRPCRWLSSGSWFWRAGMWLDARCPFWGRGPQPQKERGGGPQPQNRSAPHPLPGSRHFILNVAIRTAASSR
jgi:hypothetical protein